MPATLQGIPFVGTPVPGARKDPGSPPLPPSPSAPGPAPSSFGAAHPPIEITAAVRVPRTALFRISWSLVARTSAVKRAARHLYESDAEKDHLGDITTDRLRSRDADTESGLGRFDLGDDFRELGYGVPRRGRTQ